MAVAFGDQRRRLDAIELLVGEITSTQIDWNSDSIPLAIRNALEVRRKNCSCKTDSFYVVQLLSKGSCGNIYIAYTGMIICANFTYFLCGSPQLLFCLSVKIRILKRMT